MVVAPGYCWGDSTVNEGYLGLQPGCERKASGILKDVHTGNRYGFSAFWLRSEAAVV